MHPINKQFLTTEELLKQADAAESAARKIKLAGGFVGAVENLLGVAKRKRETAQKLLDDAQDLRDSAELLETSRSTGTFISTGEEINRPVAA